MIVIFSGAVVSMTAIGIGSSGMCRSSYDRSKRDGNSNQQYTSTENQTFHRITSSFRNHFQYNTPEIQIQ
jgi:hypothetical protein